MEQRRDLLNLGVTDEQIAELEAVLPGCRVFSKDLARLGDVRDALQGLASAVSEARRKALNVVTAGRANAALLEVRQRIKEASADTEFDLGEVVRATAILREFGDVVGAAVRDLPNQQRRSRAAAVQPIQLIHEALTKTLRAPWRVTQSVPVLWSKRHRALSWPRGAYRMMAAPKANGPAKSPIWSRPYLLRPQVPEADRPTYRSGIPISPRQTKSGRQGARIGSQ
jgi:hypothetical protein